MPTGGSVSVLGVRGWWLAIALLAAAAIGCGAKHATPRRPAPAAGSRRPPKPARRHAFKLAHPPVATRGAASERAAIPILMYHVMSAAPPGVAYPQLWVSETLFRDQMRALAHAGYHAITLAAAYAAWEHGGPLPAKPIVLSFDDGYASDSTHARPVLRSLHWPGVLNLALHNLGKNGISTKQVKALIASGWEIDSHTLTHPDLTTLDDAALAHELAGSKAEIERRFGQRAEFFCYPAGRYDARVAAAVEAAGYRAATTEHDGLATGGDPFALKRIRVGPDDTPARLLARLRASRPA
jgi:peptidoglycan/xylan/chitin deacetylase (PgdA/CDA1 family)